MIYNNVRGTTSKQFKIGKNGVNIDATDTSKVTLLRQDGMMSQINCENIPEYESSTTLPCKRNFVKEVTTYPKFKGITKISGEPSPDLPSIVSGVLNPKFLAYFGDLVEINDVEQTINPLMKLSDGTCDRITLQNDVWGIERNVCKFMLDGSIDYHLSVAPQNQELAHFYTLDFNNKIDLFPYSVTLSNMFDVPVIFNEECFYLSGHPNPEIIIKKSRLKGWSEDLIDVQKVALFKNWATENPITCYAKLNHPIFEPISAWCGYGKINPIVVDVSIVKSNKDVRISPDNTASISGTLISTTAYKGQSKQLTVEMFDGDSFDKVNLIKTMQEITFDGTENFISDATLSGKNRWFVELPDSVLVPAAMKANATCNHYQATTGDEIYYQDYVGFSIVGRSPDIPVPRIHFFDPNLQTLEAWKAKLAEWAINTPLKVIYETKEPTVTREDLSLNLLSNIDYAIEIEDENGYLNNGDTDIRTNSNIYGNPVYNCSHIKIGNTHYITGRSEAQRISFIASDINGYSDVWKFNDAVVKATYSDGQILLPTAITTGEIVYGVLDGNVLRLILQKPSPQKNLLVNSIFTKDHLVNQRLESVYTSDGFTIDMWRLWSNYLKLTVNDDYIRIEKTNLQGNPGFMQLSRNKDLLGKTVTGAIMYRGKFSSGAVRFNICKKSLWLQQSDDWNIVTLTTSAELSDFGSYQNFLLYGLQFRSYMTYEEYIDVKYIKLEQGDCFTGLYEPTYNETLLECQKYLLMGPMESVYMTSAMALVPTPVTMPTIPNIIGNPQAYGFEVNALNPVAQIKVNTTKLCNGVIMEIHNVTVPHYVFFPYGSGLSAELTPDQAVVGETIIPVQLKGADSN